MPVKMFRPSISILKPSLPVAPSPTSWRAGKTTAERGYGSAWQRARKHHLDQHPLCWMCERDGLVTAATVVDHHEPHRGDPALFWDRSNWRSLCAPHHSSEKQRQEMEPAAEQWET